MSETRDCPECNGKGYIEEDAGGGNLKKYLCDKCNGRGYIDIEIEEGGKD